jgi:hypothetical protein
MKLYMFHAKMKFVKLVHLVGSIVKKFVTMHGHTNVNFGRTVRIPVKDGCMGFSSAVAVPAPKVVLRLFCP